MEMVLASGALQSVTHGLQVENAKSIEDLAREIEENTEAGDDALIATAMLVRQLKCRIEAGEAGPGVSWLTWAKARFNKRKSQLYKLITIGNAPDPRQALKDFRVRENNRQKTCRQRRENGDDERSALVKRVRQCDRTALNKISRFLTNLGY